MAKLYEKFTAVTVEVSIDPHSIFWQLIEEQNLNDPLSILIRAEEGDEEAEELTRHFQFHRTP